MSNSEETPPLATSRMSRSELAEVFRVLGAQDPEGWAASQIDEGIPQLARFAFLKLAWETVVREDDTSWIDEEIARASSREDTQAGMPAILKRLVGLGVSKGEITEIARQLQYRTMFGMMELIEDPRTDCLDHPAAAEITWALVQIHPESGEMLGEIDGMHEDALGMDPTGREMRPRI